MDALNLVTYRNRIYSYLIASPYFDVTNAGKYVNYTYRGRNLQTNLYPCLSVYFTGKQPEHHVSIGYSPWATYMYAIDIQTMVPVPGPNALPSQLLSDLGLTTISTVDEAEIVCLHILSKAENVLRFTGVDEKRRLDDPTHVAWALPKGANCGPEKLENGILYRAVLDFEVYCRVSG